MSVVNVIMWAAALALSVWMSELTELLLRLAGSTLPIEYKPAGQTFVTNRIGSIAAADDWTSAGALV